MQELDPVPCTGTRPPEGTRAHCSTCYRLIQPTEAAAITPHWRVIPASHGLPAAAVCLSHVDRHELRHLHRFAQPEPPVCGGLVSRVTACVRALFKRGGAA